MKSQRIVIITSMSILVIFVMEDVIVAGMSTAEKREIREKVIEMFHHAYDSYMNNAFPADELMPLSCKGRYRGTSPSRGDIDDSLGNFTLTLIDTLDTLVVLGQLEEFDRAVKLVIKHAKFDSDINVSVFETNIRVLGGLLGGHVVASFLKKKKKSMDWYNDELLSMAKDVGYKLLPAFNTSTGIPYPRVNLKYGITPLLDNHKDTCTACAGTMILEFAALSRLSGEPIFEEKAHKAMDYLWKQRHRASDLVGTVINVHNGDWIRRESGVGAGIDSYYEYVLKAYILLDDDIYLNRFNKHYEAVMKYISQGPMLLDVHMHKPQATSRHFMDALLAFWPGLQVLKGDIRPAIETHEMLYQIIQRHNFLPEAFTTDFRVHWGHHPLRPEFLESTYFLHKATGDPHYLRVGKQVMENLNTHARVPCGYAAIKDVTTGTHEDQLDSYVLAETFKYLYLLFSEKSDLVLDIDDYIFTTEAHLLPLSLSRFNTTSKLPKVRRELYNDLGDYDDEFSSMTHPPSSTKESSHDSCPNLQHLYQGNCGYANGLRLDVRSMVNKVTPKSRSDRPRLKAAEFIAGNKAQLEVLHKMGIRIATMADGRVQLLHSASDAASTDDAEDGMKFMQEMIQLSRNPPQEAQHEPMVVQLISEPYYGSLIFKAGPAQFGYNLKNNPPIQGQLVISEPLNGCTEINNAWEIKGKIVIMERGNCMFIDKARNIQKHGAMGGIVLDNVEGSSSESQALFAMSGDGQQDVTIPMVFLFKKEGSQILESLEEFKVMEVMLGHKEMNIDNFQPKLDGEESGSTSDAKGPLEEAAIHLKSPEVKIRTEVKQNQHISSTESKDGKLYKIHAGTTNVKLEVDVSKNSQKPNEPKVQSDDVINLKTMPDGTKQLSFRFDQLSDTIPKTRPELNQIYVNLVSILQQRTNFEKLSGQADYLMALARLLETAYFGLHPSDLDKSSGGSSSPQDLFDKLAKELEILPSSSSEYSEKIDQSQNGGETTDQSGEAIQHDMNEQIRAETWHYATEQELHEPQEKIKPKVKKSDINVVIDEATGKTHVVVTEDDPNTPEGPDTVQVFQYTTDSTLSVELPPNEPFSKLQKLTKDRILDQTIDGSEQQQSDEHYYEDNIDLIGRTETVDSKQQTDYNNNEDQGRQSLNNDGEHVHGEL